LSAVFSASFAVSCALSAVFSASFVASFSSSLLPPPPPPPLPPPPFALVAIPLCVWQWDFTSDKFAVLKIYTITISITKNVP
jgi:hypothetical protein